MEKADAGKKHTGARPKPLGIKAGIMEALNNIQKLTISRSEDWEEIEKKKAAIQKETNEARLHGIYQMLREVLITESGDGGNKPTLKIKMPGGTIKEYSSLEDFYKFGPKDAFGGGVHDR